MAVAGRRGVTHFLVLPAMLKAFLNDLREQGLVYTQEELVPWLGSGAACCRHTCSKA